MVLLSLSFRAILLVPAPSFAFRCFCPLSKATHFRGSCVPHLLGLEELVICHAALQLRQTCLLHTQTCTPPVSTALSHNSHWWGEGVASRYGNGHKGAAERQEMVVLTCVEGSGKGSEERGEARVGVSLFLDGPQQ